jgi:ABC-2 type transport system ATP-binding protein
MMNVIEIKDLKKYYGDSRGVENASFSLNEGEILGFVGPNGAGKSTVIRVLMGLIKKTEGIVLINGNEPTALINADIGYLPSEVFLYSELTVKDQLQYFADIRKSSYEKIDYLADYLDLDLNKKIRDLSFGNRKKVGIVAALMHNPKIIILDEPTTGLDPLIQQKFLDLLIQYRNQGSSIILSSHILSEVEKICDRIALIREGVVLFSTPLKELKVSQYRKVKISPMNLNIDIVGLTFINNENDKSIYTFSGDINLLINGLNKYKLETIVINELGLEEIFMHYYQKGELND